ncbi:MAG: glycosyltransferase family 4 protein [Roseimicrobium sp.]
MRIGLIYHQFIPRGGLEGYLLEFTARLCAAGHELHIVASEVEEGLDKRLGATLHRVPLVRGSSLLRMWQFEREASRLVATLPVDVTIGFGRTTTQDLHRAGGGCHAVYSKLLPPWKRWSLKNLLDSQLERTLYTAGRTKRFVVNSTQVARELHETYGTDPSRFRVIHTAVDSERFQPSPNREALRAKICEHLKTDPARPVFLFVSLSHRRKGLDVLLDVWREVDADLWIMGTPLDFMTRFRIAKLGLADRVRTIAPKSNAALLFQAADWFIHPTLYDACANTVLQSMASGLPGLISAHDGAVEFVQDGVNGMVLPQPQDAGAVLQTVQCALSTAAPTRAHWGAEARKTVQALTWEAHLSKWMELIDELPGTEGRSGPE